MEDQGCLESAVGPPGSEFSDESKETWKNDRHPHSNHTSHNSAIPLRLFSERGFGSLSHRNSKLGRKLFRLSIGVVVLHSLKMSRSESAQLETVDGSSVSHPHLVCALHRNENNP